MKESVKTDGKEEVKGKNDDNKYKYEGRSNINRPLSVAAHE